MGKDEGKSDDMSPDLKEKQQEIKLDIAVLRKCPIKLRVNEEGTLLLDRDNPSHRELVNDDLAHRMSHNFKRQAL